MIGVPTLISVALVWVPALSSVALSFTRWDGIGLDSIKWIGLRNYREIFTIYPPFYPALWHNLIWLLFFLLIPTPIGLFLAVLLDRELRFTRVYQSVIFLPVVLSLAIVGFIWQLMYSTDQGLINAVIAKFGVAPIDWLGNPQLNLWAVLVAASWRHVGYMMILYLAGLKSVDPALKEAAAIDGANGWQVLPVRRVPGPAPDQHRGPRHHGHRVAARVRPRVRHQRRPQRPGAAVRAGVPEHHRRGQPDRLRLGDRRRSCW